MNDFAAFVAERRQPKIYYWKAESQFWRAAERRQFDIADEEEDIGRKDRISDCWKVEQWADLCRLFQEEPIVLKDCYKFGLKHIAKSMLKHGMVTTALESQCNNGMMAMINAWQCYNLSDNPINTTIMKDITKYNEFDTRILWEILKYLRQNHTENYYE
jgi:hypothetical protein